MDDDELFERLERMRKEAARYAAELAKKEDEARRAKQPLEKLQRPTLVSRTDTSITLNLYRSKNTNQTLPKDRCWELSLTKERERNYSVFTSVKGKTVVTVSDLTPADSPDSTRPTLALKQYLVPPRLLLAAAAGMARTAGVQGSERRFSRGLVWKRLWQRFAFG